MSTETPEQRRTRLIERYVETTCGLLNEARVRSAIALADTVIAATPQAGPSRYPSEIETRLIELVENCIRCMPAAEWHKGQLTAIKKDLGVK